MAVVFKEKYRMGLSNAGTPNPLVQMSAVPAKSNAPALYVILALMLGGLVSIVVVAVLVPVSSATIIASIISFVGLAIPIVIALNKVDEVHKTVNSKMTEMLNLQANASFSAGIVEGARAADAIGVQKALAAQKDASARTTDAVQAAIIEVKRP